MYSILDVLGEEPEAVEADLIRDYGHAYPGGGPLAAFWRGEVSLRTIRVMVEGLGPESATARALTGSHWSTSDYHLADIADGVASLLVAFINANRDEKKTPRPLPWPGRSWRPGDPLPQDEAESAQARREQARAAYDRVVSAVMPGKG